MNEQVKVNVVKLGGNCLDQDFGNYIWLRVESIVIKSRWRRNLVTFKWFLSSRLFWVAH